MLKSPNEYKLSDEDIIHIPFFFSASNTFRLNIVIVIEFWKHFVNASEVAGIFLLLV